MPDIMIEHTEPTEEDPRPDPSARSVQAAKVRGLAPIDDDREATFRAAPPEPKLHG